MSDTVDHRFPTIPAVPALEVPVVEAPVQHRRFGRFDLVTIDGIGHVGGGRVHGGVVLTRTDTGIAAEFTDQAIKDLEDADRLDVRRNHFRTSDATLRVKNGGALSIGDLAPTEQAELLFAERLLAIVERSLVDGYTSLSDDALRIAIATAHAEILTSDLVKDGRMGARRTAKVFCAPSPATFREWRRRYRGSDFNIMALRDGRKGSAKSKGRQIDPTLSEAFYRWVGAYADQRRPSKVDLYKLFCAEIASGRTPDEGGQTTLEVPSLRTFERAIDDLDEYFVLFSREGESAAKRRFRMSGRRPGALRPGESVIMDHWKIHLQKLMASTDAWKTMTQSERKSLSRVRLQICLATCEATRVPLGLHLAPTASGENARAALSLVCQDKTHLARSAGCRSTWHQHCSPEAIRTDAGTEFLYTPFRTAVRDLSSEHEIGPAGYPEVRAVLERQFRTLGGMLSAFTGRTLGGISDLGDMSPMEHASLCVDAIAPIIVRYLVDVYMNTPHGGLGGETPADAWERLTALYGTLPPPQVHRLRAIFGYSDTRRLGREGIRVLGLRYRSQELAHLRRRKGPISVAVRVDLDDLGSISVRENDGASWITVPCETDGMDGVSSSSWIEATKAIRRTHAKTAALRQEIVHAALLEIRRVGDEAASVAGLETGMPTPEEMARIERKLFTGFAIRPDIGRGRTLELSAIRNSDDFINSRAETLLVDQPTDQNATENEPSQTARRRGSTDFLIKRS